MSPSPNTSQRQAAESPGNIKYLALRAENRHAVPEKRSKAPAMTLLLVVAAHVAVFYMLQVYRITLPKIEPAQPMMVSLLAAPQPEVVPVVPKVNPKPVVRKPELVKIIPKLQPVQQTEPEPVVQPPPPNAETKPNDSITPVVEQPVEPKVEPKVVEEPKIEPPRFGVSYLNNPAPAYPPVSRRLGEQGRVVLKVLVNTAGNPESVALDTGSGSDRLDQAAIDAVKQWRFVPAKRNGQALSAYVLVPLKFSLHS
ncbi:MAG TPA: energy transducer TonB [Methylophilaceae bacterium]